MELATGTRLGPYAIEKVIGAGGMGVVYRANDPRLGRQVAIKVLPEGLKHDTERLRRFEQEARTIGGLNHPNLVTLHDVGHYDGVPYLVTELLQGKSLRMKLADAAMPVREIVQIATEIAQGLAAAHGAGVVHRDIKPDNVFVMHDGRVKILDFGIAKLKRDDTAGIADTQPIARKDVDAVLGPTLGATGTGVVMGTPGYMSPEQLGGSSVDARTDIFALGVVLYEMLTRKRPFAAATGIEESYAIMKMPPSSMPPGIPAAVARIVLRCLEKRPDARFQSAADLAFALDALDEVALGRISEPTIGDAETQPLTPVKTNATTMRDAAPTAPATAAVTVRERKPVTLSTKLVLLGVVIAVCATGLVIVKNARQRPGVPVVASAEPVWPSLVDGGPEYKRVSYHSQSKWYARFAEDGRSVLYSARKADRDSWRIVRGEIERPAILDIGVDGRLLDVSPKGELAVRLKLKNKEGGVLARVKPGVAAPRQIAEGVEDAAWAPDGEAMAIIRVTGEGTTLEYPLGKQIATSLHSQFAALRVSRDGKYVAVIEQSAPPDTRGKVVIFDASGKRVTETPPYDGVEGIAWAATGNELWYGTNNFLRALKLDGQTRILLRGGLRMQLRDVDASGRILLAPYDARLRMYQSRDGGPWREVSWFDAGVAQSLSSDGSTAAFLLGTGIDQTAEGYATFVRTGDQEPVQIGNAYGAGVLPDGSAVFLMCGTGDRLRVVPTGAGTSRALPLGDIETLDIADFVAVQGDGKHGVVRGAAKDKPMRLWLVDLSGATPPAPIGPESVAFGHHPISPDGKLVAISDERGVALISLAGGATVTLDAGELQDPLQFTADGKSLFVANTHGWPRALERVELATKKRTRVTTIDPPDRPRVFDLVVSSDGRTVLYSASVEVSDLYVLQPPSKASGSAK